jgi:hypothetical protein
VSSRTAVTAGVVTKTTSDRKKYWKHWCQYASLFGLDPFLTHTPALERDSIVCAYGARVRTGVYGRGAQVKVQTVTDALSAISQTIQLAGHRSPLYRTDQKQYNLTIERMVEGFRRSDPPSIPQLAIPVTVPNACFEASQAQSHPRIQTAGQLTLIAFYFLLRVGEYTKPRMVTRGGIRIRATRTKQFTYSNVGFFKQGKVVSRNAPLATLLSCDAATLKITNQKNGRMGDTIHQQATGTANCPVKALALRIHHINVNKGVSSERLLCDYFDNNEWHSVQSSDIIALIRTTSKSLKLDEQGIHPDLIGAHSLRAGGAMALRLHGFADTVIMKMGRWTSLTFLQYIHTQIAHLSADISKKMSIPLPFLNIASIESMPEDT